MRHLRPAVSRLTLLANGHGHGHGRGERGRLAPGDSVTQPLWCQEPAPVPLPSKGGSGQTGIPCHAMPCYAMPCHAMPCHQAPAVPPCFWQPAAACCGTPRVVSLYPLSKNPYTGDWYRYLRVLNPFGALFCPNSKVFFSRSGVQVLSVRSQVKQTWKKP